MIKSVLDLYRELPKGIFDPREEVIKHCSGTLDVGQYAFPVFRPCNIYLTHQRLLLVQVKKILKEFHLTDIQQLNILKRKWIAGKQIPQLKIILKNGHAYYVVMNKTQDWLKEISSLIDMNVEKKG